MSLPSDPDALDAARGELAMWAPMLDHIASRHGLRGAPRPVADGTLPVFAYPDCVVKLYAPDRLWRADGALDRSADFEVERGLLGCVGSAGPAVLGDGARDGWFHLVQTRVEGRPLEQVVEGLAPGARHAALRGLGRAVRALHDTPPPAVPFAVPDFDAFLDSQVRDVVAIEEARGAPREWLDRVDAFVRSVPRGARRPALLHTELGPGHALAAPDGSLRGLIDFVDAMVGDPEYDFAAVAFFITRGDGDALGAFLDGYAWDGPRGVALARSLLRYLLLHRFAPLKWLLARRPPGDARDLESLAERWMGVAPGW